MSQHIAGQFFIGDVSLPDAGSDHLRQVVAEAIRKVLYPDTDGLVTHQHRRIRQWDEDGTEWRGVLYRVEKESEL